ncbi:hypothetical protein M8Z33_13910 [Streptomyces sp. ZAF1911]|uniref:hypothetical protein n=1 Tax=Streptomyces sp. ZAF1911 TaxID=2944129 RepID=UPI00237BE7CE|nr:hypothetical protein [Streptomyces sp. ZAF1911]MDD9377734.1 hypothetical protein [Streptomyces sp. ZAF1911]
MGPGRFAHRPADLNLLDAGRLVGRAQAKLCQRASTTAEELARPHYDGMQRLVASDRLADVENLLDKRLTMPSEGLRYENYQDARAHVTDHLEHGGVRSEGITLDEAHRAARDPRGWADRQSARAGAQQMAGAAKSAALLGGIAAGVSAVARETARVRAGETSASVAALTAVGSAVGGAARSGGLPRSAKPSGSPPPRCAAWPRWGAGRSPGPPRRPRPPWRRPGWTSRGEGSTRGSSPRARRPRPFPPASPGAAVSSARRSCPCPSWARWWEGSWVRWPPASSSRASRSPSSRPALALTELAALTRQFGGQPVYGTQEEFDAWMLDASTSLTLDPNWR